MADDVATSAPESPRRSIKAEGDKALSPLVALLRRFAVAEFDSVKKI